MLELAMMLILTNLLIISLVGNFLLFKENRKAKKKHELDRENIKRMSDTTFSLETDLEKALTELSKYKTPVPDFTSEEERRLYLVEREKQLESEMMLIKIEQAKSKEFEDIAAFSGMIEGE